MTRGHYAVEHVDTPAHALDQVGRRPHAHQVTRLALGHVRLQAVEHGQHRVLGLTDRQTADGVTIETDIHQPLQRLTAQIVIHTALHDAEQRRGVVPMRVPAAPRPAQGQLHGLRRLLAAGRIRRAVVEDHDDIRTQGTLHGHGGFRIEEHLVAVHR